MGLLSRIFRPRETAADRAQWLDGLAASAGRQLQAEYLAGLKTAARSFEAAETPAWTESWSATAVGINDDLARQLPTMRARARGQARSNEWAENYQIKLLDNVLGEHGIRLQATLMRGNGQPNTPVNDRLERGWRTWGKLADVSGLSWQEVERLALLSLAIDGELLLRLRPGAGPMGFQVQLLPADALDVHKHGEFGTHRIRMGIELDDDGAPVAYWLKAGKSGEGYTDVQTVGKHVRVPAAEIIHAFERKEVGQVRGFPWIASGAQRLWLLNDFERSAAVASSNAAKRQGFFFTPDGEAPRGFVDRFVSTALERARAEGKELSAEEINRLMSEAEKFTTTMAGQFDTLPIGYQFQPFESKWPEVSADGYVKQQVRGWSAARGISYVSLGNDLEAVNYSSAQVGILAERDHYRSIQRRLIRWLHQPVLEAALPWIVLATPGLNTLSLAKYAEACEFVPRRWSGVDPIKTANADETNLRNKLTSRRRILLERGEDPDEVFAEIEDEEARFGPVPPASGAASAAAQTEQDDDDAEDPDDADEAAAEGQGA